MRTSPIRTALTHPSQANYQAQCRSPAVPRSDRNEAHARSLRCFTDGLGIGRVVLLPLEAGVINRAQWPQLTDLACPVVRSGKGFITTTHGVCAVRPGSVRLIFTA